MIMRRKEGFEAVWRFGYVVVLKESVWKEVVLRRVGGWVAEDGGPR